MARAAAADSIVAAIMLSLLTAGCGRAIQTADADPLTPPPAPSVPPDYETACATAMNNARTLAPTLAAANVVAVNLNLKLVTRGPPAQFSCPISHNDDQGAVTFQLDCQDPTNTACVTVVAADLGGSRVYQNNSPWSHPPSPGLQSVGGGESN
jgi:hypothetical protein